MGHKISKEQIDPGVKDHIMSFVGDITDLETEVNTDIISAVNSLIVDRVDNAENMGKLANAIGNPVNASDSVDDVVNKVGELTSSFKSKVLNAGIMVNNGDKFKELIDKLEGLVAGGGGNSGIKFAEGTYIIPGYGSSVVTVNVPLNLEFIPTYIFAVTGGLYSSSRGTVYGVISNVKNLSSSYNVGGYSGSVSASISNYDQSSFTITGDVYLAQGSEIKWYAIGVGEEDTTLRDSLASILQEEGVNVTEEDNMASLITKVDEEFTKDNNTINELNTDIENTRSTLAGLMQEGGYYITGDEDINSLLDLLVLSGINVADVKQIACGAQHIFILKNDGSVWACGGNTYGQLGLGNTTNKTTFTQVTTNVNNDVKEIICSYNHTFIIKNDGSVWSCGYNNAGQLGLNDTTNRTTFTKVTTNINNDVKQISCGDFHTFIIKSNGSVWCCGENAYGQLGLGNDTDRTTFFQVTTNINNDARQIACGANHTIILKNDGSVWGCGYNSGGQLGLGDKTNKNTFTKVTTNINNDVKQIICGNLHTFIIKSNGSVWGCGSNGYGQLGIGTTTDTTTFSKVSTNINNDVKQIAGGASHTFILKNDGSLWSCGINNYGQLGLNDNTYRNTFTQVTNNINNDVTQLSCGNGSTFILKNNGSVWGCGRNLDGQLGLGDTTDRKTFTMIPK